MIGRDPLPGLNREVRVLVVDDQPLLREGVTAVLTRSPDLTIVGEASDGREAIEKFRALQPDVTVMDKLIARALTISEETAKTHVKNIIEKLGAHGRTHAVTLGLRRGILQL